MVNGEGGMGFGVFVDVSHGFWEKRWVFAVVCQGGCGVFFDVCQGFAVLETPLWEEGGDDGGFPQIAQIGTNGWVMARTPSI
jgi:hypothetical protein